MNTIDQWNRVLTSRTDPYKYSQLILEKEARTGFQQTLLEQLGINMSKKENSKQRH